MSTSNNSNTGSINARRKGPSNLNIHHSNYERASISSPKTPPICVCLSEKLSLTDSLFSCNCNISSRGRMGLISPQKYKEDSHLSPNRLSTPTSAHLDKHHFCTCPDISPPSMSLAEDNKSSRSSSIHKEILSPQIKNLKSPIKSPRRDKIGDHFNFSPSKRAKKKIEKQTKSVGTSPQKELKEPKHDFNTLSPAKASDNSKILEKSNSMDERRPQRNLRNTRSLSPRPPVRHQHAITVSDENDRTSVKLSPSDELDDVFNSHKIKKDKTKINKQTMSHKSLESSDKSVEHMIYIPSDPWQHKDDIRKSPHRSRKSDSKRTHDPWELRSERKGVTRQSKSLSSKTDDLRSYTLTIPDAKARKSRPKLQRSKSPMFDDADFKDKDDERLLQKFKSASTLRVVEHTPVIKGGSIHNLPVRCSNYENSGPQSLGSPDRKKLLSLSPTLGYHSLTDFDAHVLMKLKKSSLSVSNTLQPRHSFSTTPISRDDELQLNIRRLSEQMRYSYGTGGRNGSTLSPPVYEEIATQPSVNTTKENTAVSSDPKSGAPNEPLLETRC